MAVGAAYAQAFLEIRPAILGRLMEIRFSLDRSLSRLEEREAQRQLEAMLDHIHTYLAAGDARSMRDFLRTQITVRAAENVSVENLLHTIVAVGDVCVQVTAGQAASNLNNMMVLALTRATADCTRFVVELIAESLDERLAERQALLEGTNP